MSKLPNPMRTYSPRQADVQRNWHVIDASARPLGRLASEVAGLLRGKHKAMFAPHLDVGDHVIIVNAGKVGITGKNKLKEKMYYRHSGYLGSLRATSLEEMMRKRPERVIEHAVRGMLPKGSLGRATLRKLHVYAGPTHPHTAQTGRASATVPTATSPQVEPTTLPAGPIPPVETATTNQTATAGGAENNDSNA
jgi:large subunit ribosomal protein L13